MDDAEMHRKLIEMIGRSLNAREIAERLGISEEEARTAVVDALKHLSHRHRN